MSEPYEFVDWDEIFESEELEFILTQEQMTQLAQRIGYEIDSGGFIIHPETGERIHSNDSTEVNVSEIGGILPGSGVFVKKNIASFSQYLSEHVKC